MTAKLIEIVRERTGYPPGILKLDLDLEADLGIDSIKRVEILGTLRDSIPALERSTDSALMDQLTRAKTLGDIVQRVEAKLATTAVAAQPAKAATVEPDVPSTTRGVVRRLILETVDAPPATTAAGLSPGGLVLVTEDGGGVSRALGDRLRSQGYEVAFLGADSPPGIDLSSAASVDSALRDVRRTGAIAGVIHALPLHSTPAAGLDEATWAARMGDEVKGLFLLARAAADDLERASALGGSCLIAATAMGGASGSTGDLAPSFFAGQGGVAGLVKTLAREWPNVRTRVVDLDPAQPPDWLASRLAFEAMNDDGWPEVGYHRGNRVRLRAIPSALNRSASRLDLEPGQPILVTGGQGDHRGGCTRARRNDIGPRCLLIGSSPPPDELSRTPRRRKINEPAALKVRGPRSAEAANGGPPARPTSTRLTERSSRRGKSDRRWNGSGDRAQVEYARADVRHADSLGRTLDGWRSRYGDLVGVIHGAGVIHDKLLRDKKPESF